MHRLTESILSLLIMLCLISCNADSDLQNDPKPNIDYNDPAQFIPHMLRGINLGNTLEPETEGGWNNGPAREVYFNAYKDAGFTCVRVPVKWGSHTMTEPPYAIDPLWLLRVEQVIDWGLERDLFIILNAHHEDWLKQDYSEQNKARFDSVWAQIAEHFANKSPRLLFEMINEPFGMSAAQVDDLNARILGIIRETNPTRTVIYSGNEWSGVQQMMTAQIPQDDHLMAYWHAYDPWSFAGLGEGLWGTQTERQAIAAMFQMAADWSAAHHIPVMISEFGAVHACDYNSRMRHYASYVDEAIRQQIPFQVWDDGGNFGILERETLAWPEVKDILINGHPFAPGALTLEALHEGLVQLSWANRGEYAQLRVERRGDSTAFETLADIDPLMHTFIDSTTRGLEKIDYRLQAISNTGETYMSYPVRWGE